MTKYRHTLNAPVFIDTVEALEEMLLRLAAEPAVAVDTESNSLYAYNERVCLLQLSIPGEDYLVDPLALEDLSPLRAVFANPSIEKVFHAAEYDVMVLRRDYGFEFAGLFDTMIASRIVGWPRYGLGSLLQEHFGVETDKRMQRTNWGKRPLSFEQLEYAQLDTHFLLSLRDKLMVELTVRRRVTEAHAAFTRVAQSEWLEKRFDPEGFWRVKGATDLDDTGLAVLRALYIYRDQRAQVLDCPPFKVLNDSTLVALSQQRPGSLAELERIKGVPRRVPNWLRRRLLAIIAEGLGGPPPQRVEHKHRGRFDEAALDRYEALRGWRKERAEARGVQPDVVLSNHTLHLLAHHNPTSPERLSAIGVLNEWEQSEYGGEIVDILRREM